MKYVLSVWFFIHSFKRYRHKDAKLNQKLYK